LSSFVCGPSVEEHQLDQDLLLTPRHSTVSAASLALLNVLLIIAGVACRHGKSPKKQAILRKDQLSNFKRVEYHGKMEMLTGDLLMTLDSDCVELSICDRASPERIDGENANYRSTGTRVIHVCDSIRCSKYNSKENYVKFFVKL
uniref:ZP domain-containing protein n=1 Tax=Heligmosomoides polygyrus TaxID=6339 RepID=A0A183G6N9_HELPZ